MRESPLQKTPYGVAAAGPTTLSARADGASAGVMALSDQAEGPRRSAQSRARPSSGRDEADTALAAELLPRQRRRSSALAASLHPATSRSGPLP